MSDWDLMMPGMGLTAIGIAGVTVSYSGIAHTFIDGMHALTGLTLFIGLIILSVGILSGGVSTSNKAKATTLVVLAISFSFAIYGFTLNSSTTLVTFAGVLMAIAMPAIVMAYVAMKIPRYLRPVGTIFGMAAAAGIISFVAFGLSGPAPYLIEQEPEPEPVEPVEVTPDLPIYPIAMLEGSDIQGNPDYDPDVAEVPHGYLIVWTNEDVVLHTVTSSEDFGETFDSGIVNAGEVYSLVSDDLEVGTYEYFCQVHPWMVSTLIIQEAEDDGPQIMP